MTSPPPLDVDELLKLLPQLLPQPATEPAGDGAQPSTATLAAPADVLAALIHAVMTRLDFRLVGLSDSDRLPSMSSDDGDQAPHSNRLPAAWNGGAPESYGFRYRHHQSSLDYLVKLTKMGDRIVVNGLALQGNQTSTLTIPLSDYFSPSFFPATVDVDGSGVAQQLRGAFTSPTRCNDLVLAFKNSIVVPLIPGLQKEGFEAATEGASASSSSSSSTSQQQQQQPRPDREREGRQPPRPPFSEPDDPSLPSMPFRNPLVVGDRDLDPLGGAAPSLPSPFGGRHGGGGGGFGGLPSPFPSGPGGMGIPDMGGGMYVGPNHPMFRDRFQGGGRGPGSGMVPPGARYDPIGPGGMGMPRPGPEGPRGPDVGGPLPQPGRRSDGEPDWDDLRPPGPRGNSGSGYDDMFM